MTDFWQGVTLTIAVMAVGIIALSTWLYVRGERKRQAAVDAIMAKVASGAISVNEARAEAYYASQVRDSRVPHMAPFKRKDTH